MKEIIKKSIIGGLAFISTVFVGGMLYASIGSSWIVPATLEVGAGSGLTSTSWNSLLSNFNNLDTRVNTINSRSVFSVYSNQASSAPMNTWVKIPFNVIEFDSNSFFNTSTNRFQPTIAGYYNINLTTLLNATSVGASHIYGSIHKNSTSIKQTMSPIFFSGNFNQTLNSNIIVYLNGTTDYIEGYYYYNGAGVSVIQGLMYTYMQGIFLRP